MQAESHNTQSVKSTVLYCQLNQTVMKTESHNIQSVYSTALYCQLNQTDSAAGGEAILGDVFNVGF